MSNVLAVYLLGCVLVTLLSVWAWGCWWLSRRILRWFEVRCEVRQCERILELMHRYDIDVDQALEYAELEAAGRPRVD